VNLQSCHQPCHVRKTELLEHIQNTRLDPGLLRKLVDNWGLEANLGEKERVWLPAESVEDDELGALQIAVCVRHPCGCVQLPHECGVEDTASLLKIKPLVGAEEDGLAAAILDIAEGLPQECRLLRRCLVGGPGPGRQQLVEPAKGEVLDDVRSR